MSRFTISRGTYCSDLIWVWGDIFTGPLIKHEAKIIVINVSTYDKFGINIVNAVDGSNIDIEKLRNGGLQELLEIVKANGGHVKPVDYAAMLDPVYAQQLKERVIAKEKANLAALSNDYSQEEIDDDYDYDEEEEEEEEEDDEEYNQYSQQYNNYDYNYNYQYDPTRQNNDDDNQ